MLIWTNATKVKPCFGLSLEYKEERELYIKILNLTVWAACTN